MVALGEESITQNVGLVLTVLQKTPGLESAGARVSKATGAHAGLQGVCHLGLDLLCIKKYRGEEVGVTRPPLSLLMKVPLLQH